MMLRDFVCYESLRRNSHAGCTSGKRVLYLTSRELDVTKFQLGAKSGLANWELIDKAAAVPHEPLAPSHPLDRHSPKFDSKDPLPASRA
jgi:hypothetical protein